MEFAELETDVSDSGNAVGEVNSSRSIETLAAAVTLALALALAVAVKPSEPGRVPVAYAESDIVIGKSVAVD